MGRPKKIIEESAGGGGVPLMEMKPYEEIIKPLEQEFNSISEMNVLRDKINEIIKKLQ